MSNGPRTWKYAIPAFLAIVIYIYSTLLEENFVTTGESAWQLWALVGYGAAGVSALISVVSLGKYVVDFVVNAVTAIVHARSETAEVRRLEAAKNMHPETLSLLYLGEQRGWLLRAGIELPDGMERHDVLYAAPKVTSLFLWHFIRSSNDVHVMSKRSLKDQTHNFDPTKKVTDYEQYDILVTLLQHRSVITAHSSNSTPYWIPPWNPKLLAEDYGYEWDDDDEDYDIPNLSLTEGALNDGRNSFQDQQRQAGAGTGQPVAAAGAGRAETGHPGAQGTLPASDGQAGGRGRGQLRADG